MLKRLIHVCLLLLLVGAPPAGAADEALTPTALPGGRVLTAEETKGLLGKALFFDMRKAVNYGKGHLAGAVALPYEQRSEKRVDFDATLDQFDRSQLPADKARAMVFYSDGPGGWKSYKAAVLCIRDGYTQVMWFRGGTAEWAEKGYPLER
ncbi:MAG: rhodanese-like domain-containing protein [Deferrisomatales bacterium]